MGGVRVALVAMLGAPLGGCFGVTLPPKELPAWAMSPQVQTAAPIRTQTATTRRKRSAREQTASFAAGTTPQSPDLLPFSPEWTARENAVNDRLRRRMNICGNC
jgi:hypothetical protein